MIKFLLAVCCVQAKILTPCNNIHPNLLAPLEEIAKDLNRMAIPLQLKKENPTGIVCQEFTTDYYGVCVQNSLYNTTDIYISHRLLFTPNTLYNVLYHEVLHAFWIDHSDLPGLMNYSVRLNWLGYINDDSNKLYPSFYELGQLK